MQYYRHVKKTFQSQKSMQFYIPKYKIPQSILPYPSVSSWKHLSWAISVRLIRMYCSYFRRLKFEKGNTIPTLKTGFFPPSSSRTFYNILKLIIRFLKKQFSKIITNHNFWLFVRTKYLLMINWCILQFFEI